MKRLSRRSFVAQVTGGLLLGGGALIMAGSSASARPPQRGLCSDTERSPNETGGNNRRCRTPAPPSLCSDRDPSDRAGHGRRCTPGMTAPWPAS